MITDVVHFLMALNSYAGDSKHHLVNLQRSHSIAGRARAIGCVKPERLSRKVHPSLIGGRHASITCASGASLGTASRSTVLVSPSRLSRRRPRAMLDLDSGRLAGRESYAL